jgi:predicted hydrocarbon binding protein
MANDAEERLVLLLGRYGILHLCRSEALDSINTAAQKGVVVQVIAQLDRRTTRFFEKLHDSIEIKHSDDLDSQGFLQDCTHVVQFLNIEENPVGRGKEDAALVIESQPFAKAQENLIDTIWEDAVQFATAEARFTKGRIHDPLRLTIGEGSFLDSLVGALGVNDLPEHDTPFDPEAFMAAGKEVNQARQELTKGRLSNLKILGIDLSRMLRQVGNRVGHELAFSLRSIENHVEFLDEMMDWWEYAGLGRLEYGIDPVFHVQVGLDHPPSDDPDVLPMWELDDGIIEGALMTRFPRDGQVSIRRFDGTGESDDLWRYHIIMNNEEEPAESTA